jgi:uncharacterized protein YbdZ (MbtH family)
LDPPLCGPFPGISVLENAKERPSAWPSVVFMEPWRTLDPLLTQATLLTRPNLFKEAPWVGQRRKTAPPLCGPFPGISVLENAKERPSAWPSVVFMEPWSTLGPLLTQATLSTRPNLFKEAPWVGKRRQTGPPLCGPFPVISVLENAKERPSAWPSVVFMEPWSTLGPL